MVGAVNGRERIRGSVAGAALAGLLLAAAALAEEPSMEAPEADPLGATPPRPVPDLGYFRRHVEPLLKDACSFCHRGGRGGTLDLSFGAVSGGEDARVRRNFNSLARFIDPADPASSLLLRKGMPVDEGGLPHADRAYLEPGTPLTRALLDFTAGATVANGPPVAVAIAPVAVPPGREVTVDGSASADPEGAPLAFAWSLVERPPSSAALLSRATGPRTSFTADREGTFILRMRCGDGTLEAVPALVRVTVDARVSAPAAGDGAMGPDGGMMPGAGTPDGGPMMGPDATELSPLAGMNDHGPALTGGGERVTDGEPAPLGTPSGVFRYARGVFFDLRGRGPTPGELGRAVGREPEAMVDAMLTDPATWQAWLDAELYYYLLIDRFRPVSDRVLALPALLASGEANFRDATREILVSAEFNVRNPGNDTFVTVVLEQLMGMVVQDEPKVLATGKKMYDGIKIRFMGQLGNTQSDIVRIIMEQPEFTQVFVKRNYARIFGRPMDGAAALEAAQRLRDDPDSFRPLLREWLLSREYRMRTAIPRAKNDLVFIRTLFTDLLRREPTFEEFRNMRNAFLALSDPAPVRNVLAQLLLESPDAHVPTKESLTRPDDWVRRQFLDLLGREPTDAERDTFVTTLGEYGCEPRTLLLALVTSPHYQYY